jgi:hypothetical protein
MISDVLLDAAETIGRDYLADPMYAETYADTLEEIVGVLAEMHAIGVKLGSSRAAGSTRARLTLELLRDLPIYAIRRSHLQAVNRDPTYDWWHPHDFLLVEEIVNACQRNSRGPLDEVKSALSLLGEAKLEEARKIAAFRATLRNCTPEAQK